MLYNKIKLKTALFLFFIFGFGQLYALNQNDLKIIPKVENIRYLSQKIANSYLYFYNSPQKKEYSKQIDYFVEKIEDDLRFIAKNTSSDDIKNILDFLSYGKDQIKDILKDKLSRESVSKVLEYCDTLVEGAKSILQEKGYQTLKGEMKFYIYKLSKLYMAIHLKFDPSENTKLLLQTKNMIENIITKSKSSLFGLWSTYRDLIDSDDLYFIPNLLYVMIWDLERNIG